MTLAQLRVIVPGGDTDPMDQLRRFPGRLAWACVCLAAWPIYYAVWAVKWMVPYWPFWSSDRAWDHDVRLTSNCGHRRTFTGFEDQVRADQAPTASGARPEA